MQKLFYILFLFSFIGVAQQQVKASIKDSTELKAENIFGVDTFGTLYYATEDYSFHKKTKDTTITYTNFQLGEITMVNTFNPLKINLFYKDFNSVIILDNRLAEIVKIDFNTLSEFRMATHISTGHDNTIWLFNQNTQELELFDYVNRNTRIKTLPINEDVLDLKSNYNYCWLLTKKHILVYNYIGSLIKKLPNNGFSAIEEDNENLFLKKDNNLFFLPENASKTIPLKIPELLINQFLVTNETLYIYADEMLHQFQLKKK